MVKPSSGVTSSVSSSHSSNSDTQSESDENEEKVELLKRGEEFKPDKQKSPLNPFVPPYVRQTESNTTSTTETTSETKVENTQKSTNRSCFRCNIVGHVVADCPLKYRQSRKERPSKTENKTDTNFKAGKNVNPQTSKSWTNPRFQRNQSRFVPVNYQTNCYNSFNSQRFGWSNNQFSRRFPYRDQRNFPQTYFWQPRYWMPNDRCTQPKTRGSWVPRF